MFKALMLERRDGTVEAVIRELDESALPEGDTLVDVEYSSLNYKDGLAITGKGKVIRGELPFIPGIDLAGRIVETTSGRFDAGDRVVVTGWQIGEKYWGGYSQKQRVRSEWLVPIPESLSTRQAMILGTAGLTAMLSVMALEHQGLKADQGEVVVTGASGGVGSIAIALLAARGYRVVASTGSQANGYLEALGAGRIIDRRELPAAAEKPLDKSRWAGAIDTVGGATLAGIISQLATHASVAACGNASGFDLETTVFPFILRGVNLLGIDSNTATFEQRSEAWNRMAGDLSAETLERIESEVIGLEQIAEKSRQITEGKIDGRVVIDLKRS
jgi:acrylyl-CoA reductase (NADPH)